MIRSRVYPRERLSAAPPNTLPWVRGTGPTPLCSPRRAHLAMDVGCSATWATRAPWAQARRRFTAAVATARLAAGYSPLLSLVAREQATLADLPPLWLVGLASATFTKVACQWAANAFQRRTVSVCPPCRRLERAR
jgi:hypothetical protein